MESQSRADLCWRAVQGTGWTFQGIYIKWFKTTHQYVFITVEERSQSQNDKRSRTSGPNTEGGQELGNVRGRSPEVEFKMDRPDVLRTELRPTYRHVRTSLSVCFGLLT